jgi:hypothetical protein
MRILAIITTILGIAAIVFGVLFIVQAGNGQQEITDSIAPLTIDKVAATYDQVSSQLKQIPQDNANYLPTSLQKTSLGLAKSNIGAVKAVRTNGYIDIGVGLALVLTGIGLMAKGNS